MQPEVRDDRQLRALTGVSTEKLSILEAAFALALDDEKERVYREGVANGTRQRKPGGGRKGNLPTAYEKLVFLLYYLFSAPCKTGFAQNDIFGLLAVIFAEISADPIWLSAN